MKGYTYFKIDSGYWMVANPSGIEIAQTLTWRTARKIADAMNHHGRWMEARRRVESEIRKHNEARGEHGEGAE